ncbi:LamG domain-containing protein [Candidatus Poribacteria bacterium]
MRETIKILALAIVCSILVGAFTSQSPAQIDSETVVGMWLFDDGDGETAKDSSEKGNHGKLFGPEWVDGKIGKALKFDGVDDYVDCGEDPSLNLVDHLTLAVWVKHEVGNDGYIIMRNDPGDGVRQYGLLDYPTHGTGVVDFFFHSAGGRVEMDKWEETAVNDNEWHHIAITIDYPEIRLFVDGVDQGVQTLPDNMVSTETSVWIGKRKPNNFAFKGIIDEVGIFNVGLSEDDVKRIMNDGLVASLAVSPMSKLAASWVTIKTQY